MGGGVRHQVMAKLKNKEDTQKVKDSLMTMAKGLPGVTWTSFNVVTDLGLAETGLAETNADVSLIVDFPDTESYLAYAQHPTQLSTVHSNQSYVANRVIIQYQLPEK